MALVFLLLVAFVLIALVMVPIAGVVLLATERKKTGTIVLAAYGLLAASFLVTGMVSKRSTPGRIICWFHGEGGEKQTVNDLAEDIRQQPALAHLQPWSIETFG